MPTPTPSLSLKDIYQEPGVKDLQPMKCRAAFARALQAEREGNTALAEEQLDIAVAAETKSA
jgi:hypothetical protein